MMKRNRLTLEGNIFNGAPCRSESEMPTPMGEVEQYHLGISARRVGADKALMMMKTGFSLLSRG